MEQRYGVSARAELANQLAAQAADRIFSSGGLASSIELTDGAASGDLKFSITVTHLPDLPAVGRNHGGSGAGNRQHALGHLNSAYGFTLAAPLIDRELHAISEVAESQMDSTVAGQPERSRLLRSCAS
jgi:hypothetical protein